MAIIKPPVKNVWADTGDKTEPSGPEVLTGWPNSALQPSRQRFNWILNFLSNGVRYLTRAGIADWDAAESYQIGDYVRSTNGLSYRALTANTNKLPQSNLTDWERWGMTAADLASFGFSTGDVKLSIKTIADATWIMCNDLSIGSAASGATGRANADTQPLYELIWNNIPNKWAPVVGGRGLTAAADFAANKPLFLFRMLGRALAIAGAGSSVVTGGDADVDTGADTLTVPANNDTWITGMPVIIDILSGSITGTGISNGAQVFIYRDTNTTVKLCTSLGNAQNGIVINITAKSSPSWRLTYYNVSRELGEWSGENQHAQYITELVAHGHIFERSGAAGSGGSLDSTAAGTKSTNATGGNNAMNITQPSSFLNAMIKL